MNPCLLRSELQIKYKKEVDQSGTFYQHQSNKQLLSVSSLSIGEGGPIDDGSEGIDRKECQDGSNKIAENSGIGRNGRNGRNDGKHEEVSERKFTTAGISIHISMFEFGKSGKLNDGKHDENEKENKHHVDSNEKLFDKKYSPEGLASEECSEDCQAERSPLDASSVLRKYHSHALRLVTYRQYLRSRKGIVSVSFGVPLCLRPVHGASPALSRPPSSPPSCRLSGAKNLQNTPGNVPGNVPGNEKNNAENNENYGKPVNETMGGSYSIKNGVLLEITDRNNNNDQNDRNRNSSSSSSSSSASSSQHYQNNHKNHNNHTDYYTLNTVKLESASGVKYTAYPTQPGATQASDSRYGPGSASELAYGSGSGPGSGYGMGSGVGFGMGSGLGASTGVGSGSRALSGQGSWSSVSEGMFCKVRGVFPDRSQVDLCLQTKVTFLCFCDV